MRNILIILEKEFKQIFRNRSMLPIIFIMPFLQLIILAPAVNLEVKNLKLHIIDNDKSSTSRLLVSKLLADDNFAFTGDDPRIKNAEIDMQKDKNDLIIQIPQNFEKDLVRNGNNQLRIITNAIDASKAGMAINYASSIIRDFNKEIAENLGIRTNITLANPQSKNVIINEAYWYNPELNYTYYMVPGILGLLVTMIGGFLSGMNVVREVEVGTIEQINVTPIKKYEFIIGKLMPLWFIAMFDFIAGSIFAIYYFDLPFVGKFSVLIVFVAIFLLAMLGLGLFIATMTSTQQQAMFITWFFMVLFILLSGLFTPIENMPDWTQALTRFNPIRYLIEVLRMVMLKGSSFSDISSQIYAMIAFAIGINTLAVIKYKKTN